MKWTWSSLQSCKKKKLCHTFKGRLAFVSNKTVQSAFWCESLTQHETKKTNHMPKNCRALHVLMGKFFKTTRTFFKQRQTATPKRNPGHKLKTPTEKWLRFTDKGGEHVHLCLMMISPDLIPQKEQLTGDRVSLLLHLVCDGDVTADGTVSQVSLHFPARCRESADRRETIWTLMVSLFCRHYIVHTTFILLMIHQSKKHAYFQFE